MKKSIPLQYILTIPFVFLMTLVASTVLYMSWRNGQTSVRDLMYEVSEQADLRVKQHLDQYLQIPLWVNYAVIDSVAFGEVDLKNTERLKRFLLQKVNTLEGMNTLQIGTAQGDYLGVGWDAEEQPIFKFAGKNTGDAFNTYGITDDGQIGQKASSRPGYDLNTRPWYTEGALGSQPSWTPAYIMFSHSNLGMTLSQAIRDAEGRLLGVVGTDILLAEVSRYLSTLKISDNAVVYITDKQGNLVANNKALTVLSDNGQRLRAGESDDVLMRNSARFIVDKLRGFQNLTGSRHYNYKTDAEDYLLHTSLYGNRYGVDWVVVIAIPEQDFLATIETQTQETLMLCLLLIAFAIVIGWLITMWVTRSIKKLQLTIQNVGDENAQNQKIYRIYELQELSDTFTDLSMRLKQTFKMLKKMNTDVEGQVQYRTAELEQANIELQKLSLTDRLTDVANRRHFDEYYLQQWEMLEAYKDKPMSIIICDIDHFKKYNDNYGHKAGDDCLAKVAEAIQSAVRAPFDLVARYGGEEFVIVMPKASNENAVKAAGRVQKKLADLALPHEHSLVSDRVTLSVGVASTYPSTNTQTRESLFEIADEQLYKAKEAGRNQVCNAGVK